MVNEGVAVHTFKKKNLRPLIVGGPLSSPAAAAATELVLCAAAAAHVPPRGAADPGETTIYVLGCSAAATELLHAAATELLQ